MEKNSRIWLSALFVAVLFGVAVAQKPMAFLKEGSKAISDTSDARINHNVSARVNHISSSFPVNALNTSTEIWIYLPEGYDNNKLRYPVIYFTGGEHAFSDSLSSENKEWMIDETLDSLQIKASKSIVVAVHNFISDTSQIADAARFLTTELKPYIDSLYRTNHVSVIAGYDLNASLALYTTLKFPTAFNSAGIFSPRPDIFPYLKNHSLTGQGYKGKIFFYEGDVIEDLYELTDQIALNSKALLYSTHAQNPKRFHSPMGGWFPEFYSWIFSNGFNHIIR